MSSIICKSGPQRRVINPRAAVILVAVVAAAVFGMRRLHDQQFSGTLEFLRNTALKSLEAKDYRTAQLQLSQYLAMKSGDLDAREKLSLLLTEHIRTPQALEQAFRLNEELLRKGLNNNDLRLRHAGIAVKLNRMTDAEAHLTVLQSAIPDNAEVWYLSAITADAARDEKKSLQCLKRSLKCPVKVPEAYAFLARLAKEDTPAEFQPEVLMAQMIEHCPSGKAYQIRADYSIERRHHAEAIPDLWKAIEESPEDLVLNAKLVRCLHAVAKSPRADNSEIEKAVQHFETRIQAASQNPAMRLHLAGILWQNQQRSRAIEELEKSIQVMPRAFSLHETLIEYLVTERQGVKARRILESIPAGALSREAYHYCHGRILMAEGRWKEAAASLEQTLAFGRKETGLFARAQMSYAICRSRSGESQVALEAFRTVVASSPDSTSARLGMAAAWVQSGQLDLAIAEYRQLQNVTGVKECLADLLIRKNMQQPASLRNWSDVDALVSEENPQISDPVQRLLLRADRFFASGQILTAIKTLEHGIFIHPNRLEVNSAQKRLQTDLSDGLRERLSQLAKEQPDNVEIRAAQVRQTLAASGITAALAEVSDIANQGNGNENALLLAIRTLNQVAAMELKINRHEFVEPFEQSAIGYAQKLSQINPAHERELVRTLMRSGKIEEALKLTTDDSGTGRPELRAEALLTMVRTATNRNAVIPQATQSLYSLIARNPSNVELRMYYAELMLYARQYGLAEQTLAPLKAAAESDGRVNALRAWLRVAEERDLTEASALISAAIIIDSKQTVFHEVQARILLSQEQPEKARQILEALPNERLSLAGQIYHVCALMKLDRVAEAQARFDQIHALNDNDALLPADEDLLEAVSSQILQPTTASR